MADRNQRHSCSVKLYPPVNGPRPERPILNEDIEAVTDQWRTRWFVKPGQTDLAQTPARPADTRQRYSYTTSSIFADSRFRST